MTTDKEPVTGPEAAIIAGMAISKAVKSGKIGVNAHGHFRGKTILSPKLVEGMSIDLALAVNLRDRAGLLGGTGWPTDTQIAAVCAWLEGKGEPVYGVPLGGPLRLSNCSCSVCGERHLAHDAVLNGDTIDLSADCPYPKGVPVIKGRLYVPSGGIVVANDLRDLFPIIEPDVSVNNEVGIQTVMKAYEEVGLLHGCVGNTCPDLYRLDDTRLYLGNMLKNCGKRVASVCTDLWWYSIADYDEFVKRAGAESAKLPYGAEVVQCKPGVYEYSHRYHRLPSHAEGKPYMTMRWVAARPRQLPDYNRAYDRHYTAGQIIHHAIESWPTLFKSDKVEESAARVADHLLATVGNGEDYHPNGWLGGKYEMGEHPPDMEIPVFDGPLPYVYPLCDYSFIATAVGLGSPHSRVGRKHKGEPIYLNPSFVTLSFNYLRALLLYGEAETESVRDNGKGWVNTVGMAKKCILALANQYPKQVPDNCVDLLVAIRKKTYTAPQKRVKGD